MSEEILKALMQLFAIIAKQDEGVEKNEVKYVETFLRSQLSEDAVEEYMDLFTKKAAAEERTQKRKTASRDSDAKRTSVIDSVRVLGICKKINRTLNQKQKVIVLARLYELINSDRKFSKLRMEIINTVAEVFNITKSEFVDIETFVMQDIVRELDRESMLIVHESNDHGLHCKNIKVESLHGNIVILQIKSAELYFLKYTGKQDVFLNGLSVYNNRIYLFAPGSTIKLPKGKPVYYSDVVAKYMADSSISKLSFEVKDLQYTFQTGDTGLRNINFSVNHGKLVGIMGASGSGKTTMLNALSGITAPSEGAVLINGIDLHRQHDQLEGVIGYIPQDDLLIEELTVFQNLYYNAKLCFKEKNEEELNAVVNKTLKDLGLFDRKDLKVGNAMNKMISGGQRKRLNIALELIREPSILFVDEPTSGLSSRDSENVMELLSELTLKGKLIFVVIHQPSSDIYKMFDRMLILDNGGYLIYYGNPVEAIVYFKTIDNQINSEAGECQTCGNVTPEMIFNIVEAKVVDEFGQYTEQRKITPPQWETHYKTKEIPEEVEKVAEQPQSTLNIPGWFRQLKIFTVRDVLSKISNRQYLILNLVESPLLGFILAFLIRYIADPASKIYIFYDNQNIPPYIFMSIVVALFLGLTVSAEEIFRDRKILKREKFLNLSRSSYLMSKISILVFISAIQAILFVLIGNSILGIRGMILEYWLALFTTFVFANMMGLNISATFNSAVTIYILIPLLMIPQMALGGAMFSFDKLNRLIGSVDKVPVVAEFMSSRWAYEALMVNQFKHNDFEEVYFDVDRLKSIAGFKQTYFLPQLTESLDAIDLLKDEKKEKPTKTDSLNRRMNEEFALLKNEMHKENVRIIKIKTELIDRKLTTVIDDDTHLLVPSDAFDSMNPKDFDDDAEEEIRDYVKVWDDFYSTVFAKADNKKEKMKDWQNSQKPGTYNQLRKDYHNEHLDDIVRNVYEKNKILRYKDKLIQQDEPIFLDPDDTNFIGFRSHFYAPRKYFLGRFYETFWFNIIVIWIMSISLYVPLYYEHLKKLIDAFDNLSTSFKKKRKNKKTPLPEKKIKKTEETEEDKNED
jgi:ABC-type multidrug transport system ATPase subunit